MNKIELEIDHFTNLNHIWWGAKTIAGQKRYDNKFKLFKVYCKPKKNHRILEIGCGDGEFTKRLAELSSDIVAVDITPSVIKKAKNSITKKNLIFKIENTEKMTFKNNSFDIICGVSILHHTNIEQTLIEVYRILRARGQIFFTEPNLLNPMMLYISNSSVLRKKMEFSPNESALIRWKVEKILQKIGFDKILVRNYDFLHPKTPKRFIKIMEKISGLLEKTPVIKELSGSIIIWAEK